MLALPARSLLLAALALGAPAQDQLDKYRAQLATMSAGQQPAPASADNAAIASALAQWKALQQTDAMPFDSYASFVEQHPGWPDEAANRRAAERQASLGSGTPANVVAYFRRYPPQTAAGGVADAKALAASGFPVEALAAARAAWRRPSLSPGDESYVLATWGPSLTAVDHDARVDALLWAGQTAAAARLLPLASPARAGAFAARLQLRTDAPGAADLATNGNAAYAGDAGFLADRAIWLANHNAWPTARTLLSQPHAFASCPADADVWLRTLLANAKGAANDGQWQLAYDIARQVDDAYPAGTDVADRPYGERDSYTDLVWLAAQAALKHLGRPADAMPLFDRYAHGSATPTVRARGWYWAGRAAERAGLTAQAQGFLAQAAGYRDQFYGQLAAEHLGRALTAPPPVALGTIDPMMRAAFNASEVVRAARFLGQIGNYGDQTAFVRQIAQNAKSAQDHLLAAQLSQSIGRPDLGVMVGRSAVLNGLADYSAAGYPTVAVPTGYEGDWTIVHAIARQESQFDRAAVSHAGAQGLMQLMPGTARETAGKVGLAYQAGTLTADPNLSIMLGSSYFDRIFGLYGSYPLAIAAYNAGPGNVNKWLAANGDPRTGAIDPVDWVEAIPISETRNYVQRVLENAVVYDLMNPAHAKSQGTARLSWYLGNRRPG